MRKCDPCVSSPPTNEQLRKLGVFWANDKSSPPGRPNFGRPRPRQKAIYLTRLHMRYSKSSFPEDLMFQVVADRQRFQARYIVRHDFTGEAKCDELKEYKQSLAKRKEREAVNYARYTGEDVNSVRKRMNLGKNSQGKEKWWNSIWN